MELRVLPRSDHIFIASESRGLPCGRSATSRTSPVDVVPPTCSPRTRHGAWASNFAKLITERGGPATTAGFLKTIARIGEAARLPFPIHPHMLRHSTGYKLANDGHDTRALQHYMGHKNIMHTVRYTEMAPDRFKDFWKD